MDRNTGQHRLLQQHEYINCAKTLQKNCIPIRTHMWMTIISHGGLTESAGEHIKLLSLEAQMTRANLTAQQTDTQVHCGHFPIWIIQSRHPS